MPGLDDHCLCGDHVRERRLAGKALRDPDHYRDVVLVALQCA